MEQKRYPTTISDNAIEIDDEKETIKKSTRLSTLELTYDIEADSYFTKKAKYLGQTAIITTIIWTSEVEYGNWFIQWFNKEKWNYLTKISNFKDKLQNTNFALIWDEENPNTLNSREFANYLMYLNSKWGFTAEILIEKLWIKNMKALIKHWNSNKLNSIAQNILKKEWFEQIIDIITNPKLLLSYNPNSLDLALYTQVIPDENFETIVSGIKNWEVPSNISEKFTSGINESYCPNSKVMKLVEAAQQSEIKNKKQEIINKYSEQFSWTEKLALKLFNKLEQSAEENPCTFNLIKIIDDFNNKEVVEYNKLLKSWGEEVKILNSTDTLLITQKVIKYNKYKIDKEIKRIRIERDNSDISKDKRALLEERLLKFEEYLNNTERALVISNSLKVSDVKKVIKLQREANTSWKTISNNEIMTSLVKTNPWLKTALETFNKESKGEKSSEIKTNDSQEKDNSSNQNFYENNTASIYDNSYRLPLENWWYIEWLTKEEAEITTNPEAAQNLVEFKNTLDELNLTKLWKFRTDIFKIISWIWFSHKNSDYLNENEIKIFLNSLITSILPELIDNWHYNIPNDKMNLKSLKNEMLLLNSWWSSVWQITDVNFSWDSYLEKIFIDKFVNRESWKFSATNFRIY